MIYEMHIKGFTKLHPRVKALHSAGLEVILDVVYNHTAEGSQLGPTLSLRSIDNATCYRPLPENRRYYLDFTGCGGDEMGRTQPGNNNAYCQDNELSWTPWDLTLAQQQFLAFTRDSGEP